MFEIFLVNNLVVTVTNFQLIIRPKEVFTEIPTLNIYDKKKTDVEKRILNIIKYNNNVFHNALGPIFSDKIIRSSLPREQ